MYTRLAKSQDIPDILRLLVQVNQVHADGRPDLFKGGKTKYTNEMLEEKLNKENEVIYVCVDEKENVLGYTFCEIQITPESVNMHYHKTLYIDDLCVDEAARKQHVGTILYENAKTQAKALGCDRILLHVWECNPNAHAFYNAMGMKTLYYAMEDNIG